MEETMLQPIRIMNALSKDSVEQREYQPLRTNITLNDQYMFYNRRSKMVGKQENGRIEQGEESILDTHQDMHTQYH